MRFLCLPAAPKQRKREELTKHMDDIGVFLDIATVAAGIFLIVAPAKAYNLGRREKQEPPASWPLKSRILGIFFTIVGGVFFYLSNFT